VNTAAVIVRDNDGRHLSEMKKDEISIWQRPQDQVAFFRDPHGIKIQVFLWDPLILKTFDECRTSGSNPAYLFLGIDIKEYFQVIWVVQSRMQAV
jgi:hypothetical protein